MFGHNSDNPVSGPDSSSGHAFPRGGIDWHRHGRKRIVQIEGERSLPTVRSHWYVPGSLLKVPEYRRLAVTDRASSDLEAWEAEGLHGDYGRGITDLSIPDRLHVPP
jgi:hypothetical protein